MDDPESGIRDSMTPAWDDDSQEKKNIALAMRLAQKQLESGEASSQITTHFLRLGSNLAKMEYEKLKLENQLLEAKIEAEKNSMRVLDIVGDVLDALKSYSYVPPGNNDGDVF